MAIRVATSLSRVFPEITPPEHQQAARRVRAALSAYAEVEDLIRVGAYVDGQDAKTDRAKALRPVIERLLKQTPGEYSSWQETQQLLMTVGAQFPFD